MDSIEIVKRLAKEARQRGYCVSRSTVKSGHGQRLEYEARFCGEMFCVTRSPRAALSAIAKHMVLSGCAFSG